MSKYMLLLREHLYLHKSTVYFRALLNINLEFALWTCLLKKCNENVDHDYVLEEQIDSLEERCKEGGGRTRNTVITRC